MNILGLRIGRSRRGRKHRKKAHTKLEKLYSVELFNAVLKSPKVLAVVVDKYGELPTYQEDELEPIIDNIRDKIQKKAVQTALKHRRRELVTRINGIIDEVMGATNRSRRQYKKGTVVDVGTAERSRTLDSSYRRAVGRGPKQGPSLITLLETLEFIALLGKLANQQVTSGVGGTTERVYVVEQNGKPVEMSEREYLAYALKQYLRQRKKKTMPTLDLPRLPEVTGPYKTIEGPAEENEEGATGIEPQ